MIDRTHAFDRRTALRSFLASAAVGLAGCSDSSESDLSDPIIRVGMSDTTLAIELKDDHSVDQLTVIQPDGESFANRSVTPGSTRETVDIGTQYPPGEYTINALDGEDTLGEQTLSIRPDVQITDLKLGRNYPDEMYEGAGDSTIRSEVILTVENNGTGPDAITQLLIEGDIPQPTGLGSNQSGIYDTTTEVGGEADEVVSPPGKAKTIYSTSRPFTSASPNVSCPLEGEEGGFTVTVKRSIGETLQSRFNVEYTGEELIDCSISISRVEQ